MIRNEVKLIGRLTADPELKYTKETILSIDNFQDTFQVRKCQMLKF